MSDRRSATRYDLSLPVRVCELRNRKNIYHDGKTRDVSARGLYFTANRDLDAGTELSLTITLPAEVTRDRQVLIKTTARVIRVDKRPGNGPKSADVAAVFDVHELIRKEVATN